MFRRARLLVICNIDNSGEKSSLLLLLGLSKWVKKKSLTKKESKKTNMKKKIKTKSIFLQYVCVNETCECCSRQEIHEQPLVDIVDVGTLVCPECGDDMELLDEIIVDNNNN